MNPPDRDNIGTWNQTTYESRVKQKLSTFSDVIAEMALRLYPVDLLSPEFQYTSMTSDLRMNCGNDYLGLILAKSFASPVYRYVLKYIPSAPISFSDDSFPISYSAHTFDMIGFYGALNDFLGTLDTYDTRSQNLLRSEMTSFITTGSPNATSWGRFPEQTALLSDKLTVSSGYHSSKCQFWLANGFFSYSWIN